MNKNQIVKQYLDNEQLLLETWYTKSMAQEVGLEDDVEFKGALPSSDEIKEKFLEWVNKHKKNLHKIICKDFNFLEKKKECVDIANLVVSISEALEFDYTNVLEVSSLLIVTVLDNFCQP